MPDLTSRTVNWSPAHEFISALTAQFNYLPTAGTAAWEALPNADPRKLIALADAGQHQVLRQEVAQTEHAQAVKDMAAGEDWSRIATEMRRDRGPAHVPRSKGVA